MYRNLSDAVSRFLFLVLILLHVSCSPTPEREQRPTGASETSRTFDVQGHRGARGLLPENTLEAFQRALELGVSTLELDLGVTRDGVVVVSHDPRINPAICRPADGSAWAGPPPLLRDLTLEELSEIDCGSLNPDPDRFPEPPRRNVPGARIPTLAEVFDLAASFGDAEVRFNIEIKTRPDVDETVPRAEFVRRVCELVAAMEMVERVTIQAFDWRSLQDVKAINPAIETAALLAANTLNPQWLAGVDPSAVDNRPIALLGAASAYVDVFSPAWNLVLPSAPEFLGETVSEIQTAGFPVIPWTVNERSLMHQMIGTGIVGLITDYPDVLIEALNAEGIDVR